MSAASIRSLLPSIAKPEVLRRMREERAKIDPADEAALRRHFHQESVVLHAPGLHADEMRALAPKRRERYDMIQFLGAFLGGVAGVGSVAAGVIGGLYEVIPFGLTRLT